MSEPLKRSSRPGTPHRLSSRSSLLSSSSPRGGNHYDIDPNKTPLDEVLCSNTGQSETSSSLLSELNDSLTTLDANMTKVNSVHESLTNFNESFSAFLYGLSMNAWCVEYSEAPTKENFENRSKLNNLKAKIKETEQTLEQYSRKRKDTAKTTKPTKYAKQANHKTATALSIPQPTPAKQQISGIDSSFEAEDETERSSRIGTIGTIGKSRIPYKSESKRGMMKLKSLPPRRPPFR
ncbi:BA75_03190T0 [Komagataella pastoris]|uniref:DASH complex subunit DAM1 n=1 Tax=Komagataella pastoris TaxID=4922 RepID=A0A1B2JD04_PICPA|nr:BA75_03190T0 [Komagataella pastoris]